MSSEQRDALSIMLGAVLIHPIAREYGLSLLVVAAFILAAALFTKD